MRGACGTSGWGFPWPIRPRPVSARAMTGMSWPGRQRAVVVLRFWHDMTEQQTADAPGIGADAVESWTFLGGRAPRRIVEAASRP